MSRGGQQAYPSGRSNSMMNQKDRKFVTMVGQGRGKATGKGQMIMNIMNNKNFRNTSMNQSVQRLSTMSPTLGSLNFVNKKNELKK